MQCIGISATHVISKCCDSKILLSHWYPAKIQRQWHVLLTPTMSFFRYRYMSARHFNASPQTADRRLWTWQNKSQLKPQQRTELSCSIFWCMIQLEGQQKNIHQHLRFKSHFRINLRPRHTKTSIKFWSINLHLYCNLIVQSVISATGFQIPGTVFHLNNMISLTPHIHRMAQQHIIWSYASVTLTQRSWTLHKVAPINFILNLNCTITYLIISPFLLFSSCSLSTIRQYLSELIFWGLGLCKSLPVPLCSFPWGELGPHLTQCQLGWGLSPYQVISWSIQPFGHNTPTSQTDR